MGVEYTFVQVYREENKNDIGAGNKKCFFLHRDKPFNKIAKVLQQDLTYTREAVCVEYVFYITATCVGAINVGTQWNTSREAITGALKCSQSAFLDVCEK